MNTVAVNQKYWKLFKHPTVALSYLSIYLASCTDNDNSLSIDANNIGEMLKIPCQDICDAAELLTQLSVVYPSYEDGKYTVNPYYIWNGQVSSPDHINKCKYWDDLIRQNPLTIIFCKKSPKSISPKNFMYVSEALEILASSIITTLR